MRVLGAGDNVVDRYVNKGLMFPGGNAVNFAVYATQCGAKAAYLGAIADDREGRLIYNALKTLGIDISHSPLKTGLATERCDVVLEEGDRIFQECSYGEGVWQALKLTNRHLEYSKGFDLIHSSCYSDMEDEIKKLRDLSALKSFDFSKEKEYREVSYLKKICPFIDIALFSGEELKKQEEEDLRKVVLSLGCRYIMITKGTEGQSFWDGEEKYLGLVTPVVPLDTLGAGDAFFASFVISLLQKGFSKKRNLTREMIVQAFQTAADFSAQICLQEGAFGFGAPYR